MARLKASWRRLHEKESQKETSRSAQLRQRQIRDQAIRAEAPEDDADGIGLEEEMAYLSALLGILTALAAIGGVVVTLVNLWRDRE